VFCFKADYADDGRTVVIAYAATLGHISGAFALEHYSPLNPGFNIVTGTPYSLGRIDNISHALMVGVNSFNGGKSVRCNCTLRSASKFGLSTLIASWNDSSSTPLIAAKRRVVALNFLPLSSMYSINGWDQSTDGMRIIANALRFDGEPALCKIN
jgi:hypothetical protein